MDWETLERKQVQRGWWMVAFGLLLLYAFLPLSAAAHRIAFYAQPGMTASSLLLTFAVGLPIVFVGIHLALVAPFVWAEFLLPQEKPFRFVGAFFLWGLPLLSFAYWRGDFHHSLHAYEVAAFLIAALGIPLTAYWRTGNALALSVGISVIAFVPLYVVEDILGPFSPLISYAPLGPEVYSLRTLSLGAALLCAALLPMPRIGRVRNRLEVNRLILSLLALISIAVVVGESQTPVHLLGPSFFRPDLNWVGYLGLLFFIGRKDRFSEMAFLSIGVLQLTSLVAQGAYGLWHSDANLWWQVRLLGMELGIAVVGLEVRRRFRPSPLKKTARFSFESSSESAHSVEQT